MAWAEMGLRLIVEVAHFDHSGDTTISGYMTKGRNPV
jgi:hypothetical protein